jgi:hypothetical protein
LLRARAKTIAEGSKELIQSEGKARLELIKPGRASAM